MRYALLAASALLLAVACNGGDGTNYEVVVRFNTSVTQGDMDDVSAFLRRYDSDLDFLIQESFPPTGRAVVETDDVKFCPAVRAELTAKRYIDGVTCAERGKQAPSSSPDQPVQNP